MPLTEPIAEVEASGRHMSQRRQVDYAGMPYRVMIWATVRGKWKRHQAETICRGGRQMQQQRQHAEATRKGNQHRKTAEAP